MNKLKKILKIRKNLKNGNPSIGSWMQIPNASVAEIIGQAGFDWVAVDLEHGNISNCQLPDLFRALELGKTLPLARLAQGNQKDCKQALDAGAGGVIIPMVESAESLKLVLDSCRWPPAGNRGVAFTRANLFGKNFKQYIVEAQQPLFIAMIENIKAIEGLDKIISMEGLDAILIGPYDLSASMGIMAQFDHPDYKKVINEINTSCVQQKIPCGIHIVDPDLEQLKIKLEEGYQFLAYSIDTVVLNRFLKVPKL